VCNFNVVNLTNLKIRKCIEDGITCVNRVRGWRFEVNLEIIRIDRSRIRINRV